MLKIVLPLVSRLFFLLSIASFIYALVNILPLLSDLLALKFPALADPPKHYTTATVAHINKHTTSKSYSDGTSSSFTRTEVLVTFYDNNKNLFKFTFRPMINTFKEGQKIKIIYTKTSFDEKQAEENRKIALEKNTDHIEPEYVSNSIPLSVLYWIQKPLLFGIFGATLLLLSYGAKVLSMSIKQII